MTLSRLCNSRNFVAIFFVVGVSASSLTGAAQVSTAGAVVSKTTSTTAPAIAPAATSISPVVVPTIPATVDDTAPVVVPEATVPPLPSTSPSAAENTASVNAEMLPSTSTPVSPVLNNANSTAEISGRPAPAQSAATAAVASAGSLTQIAMVLLLVVGLIAGIAWLLKKLGVARAVGGTTIRVVSGINLSNRERILVVEIADQWIVVGVSPGRINTLATLPRQDAQPSNQGSSSGFEAPAGKNFAQWLKQTMDKRNGASNER
jgi:flagellar protein FliO/FliZ